MKIMNNCGPNDRNKLSFLMAMLQEIEILAVTLTWKQRCVSRLTEPNSY